MAALAKQFLLSFDWCQGLASEAYLGFGVFEKICAFLVRVRIKGRDAEWLWVIVGDVPSAYLVVDRAETPSEALEVYCELMEDWVHAVREGRNLGDVYPVKAPADEEHAAMLESRLQFIREEIIPVARSEE